jgi:hypothetical protein
MIQRRTIRLVDFPAVLAEVERLRAGYDRAGAWTLAQVCDHLARVIELSLDGFPSRMPWPMRLVARWLVLPRFLRHQQFRRRFPAPDYLQPPDGAEDRQSVERLRAAVERFQGHTGPLQPSPIFGALQREQWREVHLWHCEHHLSFLIPRQAS